MAELDGTFDDFALDEHIPGLVWGVVADGKLVHVHAVGVQDLQTRRPVTSRSLFRIASMTKAFTALTVLKLRDEGRLQLDALAETYVPEMRGWRYPTSDSPRIRVRDLLHHTAGFATDDPWGDRQTPLPAAEFSRMLREGVPFQRAPGLAMEYSNLGYALLGRVIDQTAGVPFARHIEAMLLRPLGMADSGFEAAQAPAERRAQGYLWQDGAWHLEPTMAHGAFGAMGGLQTTAEDYARWLGFLLSAWPSRDGAEVGPVRRSTVREMAEGSNFVQLRGPRAGAPASCGRAVAYGMGLVAIADCELGSYLAHGGGYPGYGSFMVLMPQYGVGLFAFANRTYAAPSKPLLMAAAALHKAGWMKPVAVTPVSPSLAAAYAAVKGIYETGSVSGAGAWLSMNFLLDRDANGWGRQLSALKRDLGACDSSPAPRPDGALSGSFTWRCERGHLAGTLLLEPSFAPRIQSLELKRAGD